MEFSRETLVRIIEAAIKEHGYSKRGLSLSAGLSEDIVRNFLSGRTDELKAGDAEKILRYLGYRSGGMNEPCMIPFEHEPHLNREHAQVEKRGDKWYLKGVTVEGDKVHAKEITDDSMNAEGIFRGSVVFFDIAATARRPADGDIVIAQRYRDGGAETVVRKLIGSRLISCQIGGGGESLSLDRGEASIIARVIGSYRLM